MDAARPDVTADAAMLIISRDALPLAIVAKKQRGCTESCGCSDCDVLDDIQRAVALWRA